MTDSNRKTTTRTITARLDQATHDRLVELSKEGQGNVSELVRALLIQALDDGGGAELVTQLIGLRTRLAAVEQQLGTALLLLPLIHERLVGLETLVCKLGVHADRGREIDRAVGWKQWSAVLGDLMEIQNGLFATFEATKALQGRSRADCLRFYDKLRHGSKEDFLDFQTRLQGMCAELEATAPAVPPPRPLTRQEHAAPARLRTDPGALVDTNEEPGEEQPTLFDEASSETPRPRKAAANRPVRDANGHGGSAS